VRALVLAGGFGTRIRPLTVNIPKPLLPLVNRPILEHIVRLLARHGFSEITMLLYYQPDVIKNFFGDGTEWGVKIDYFIPTRDLGTAGAVKAVHKLISEEKFLIISGDLLTDFDLEDMVKYHKKKGSFVTIGLTRVDNPLQFGIVITDASGKIVKFLEKPTWGEVFSDTINTGIYVLEREALDYIPDEEEFDFSKDLFPKLLSQNKPLYGYIGEGYWKDIGDPDAYREAHYDILDGRVEIFIPGKKLDLIGRDVRVGKDVLIEEDVNFGKTVIIGNNTRIQKGAKIERSVIGNNCIIESGVILKDSIIWDNTYLKKGAQVRSAVIMQSVRISENVKIDKGAVVGDECSVGRNSVIRENVKIWPRKVVEESAIVSSNLVWGERWKKSLFQGAKVIGLSNIELTPELCAKLGAAYGSLLPKNSFILLGRDAHRTSRMLRRAFVGGLASTGVNVKDAQMIPLPVLRFKLQTFGEMGGVYFRQAPLDPPSTEIHFYDSRGLDISSSMAKPIERIFFREDFRRAHHNDVGDITIETRLFDFYTETYLKNIHIDKISDSNFKIVVDYSHGITSNFLPAILDRISRDIVSLNAHIDLEKLSKSENEIKKELEDMSTIIKVLNYHVGFYFYPGGERIAFVDSHGEIWSGIDALLLVVHLVMEDVDEGVILLPLYTPSIVEKVARDKGLEVRYVRADERSLCEESFGEGVVLVASGNGQFIFPEFQNAPDAMFTAGKVLDIMARCNIDFKEFSKSIEKPVFIMDRIACPWEKKGTVMRRLSEEASKLNVIFLDGIKIFHDEGWVLVRSDEFTPYIHIFIEAQDKIKADSLRNTYKKKLESLKK